MNAERVVSRIWYDKGAVASTTRVLLAPLELCFRGIVGARNALYDAGIKRSFAAGVPAVSVGNLSVGGTGKTPVAAHLVAALCVRGARPALLMRGYGDDEAGVHEMLNPGVAVVNAADRTEAARRAVREHNANVLVLDDGFQHRRLRRELDIVVMSADVSTVRHRMIPAGPWREPLASLRRASLVVITRKAADEAAVNTLRALIAETAPQLPVVVMSLPHRELKSFDGLAMSPARMAGKRVVTISAIGNPDAFEAQVRAAGATPVAARFPDHHRFSHADVEHLVQEVSRNDMAVCTLKDAVKLRDLWPRAATPLWYVSQSTEVGHGGETLDRMLDSLVAAQP